MAHLKFHEVESTVKKLQSKWDLAQPFKLLGSGSYGIAYTHTSFPNKVFKLTVDSGEVKDCLKIRKLDDVHFVKIEGIYKIKLQSNTQPTWLIIKEQIVPLTFRQKIQYAYMDMLYDFPVFEMNMRRNAKAKFNWALEYYDYQTDSFEDAFGSEYTDEFLNMGIEINKMVKAVKRYTPFPDTHKNNVGHRESDPDIFVYLDAGSYEYLKPHKDVPDLNLDESKNKRKYKL